MLWTFSLLEADSGPLHLRPGANDLPGYPGTVRCDSSGLPGADAIDANYDKQTDNQQGGGAKTEHDAGHVI